MTAPACWTDPVLHPPAALPPRHPDTDWCRDRAASCPAYLVGGYPQECAGCSRMLRAEAIARGDYPAHPHRVGKRPLTTEA